MICFYVFVQGFCDVGRILHCLIGDGFSKIKFNFINLKKSEL